MKSLAVVIEWWHPLCTAKIEEKLKRKKETLCEKYFNRVRKILKLLNRESLCYIGETNFSISTHAEFAQYIYLRSHLCLELSAFDCTLQILCTWSGKASSGQNSSSYRPLGLCKSVSMAETQNLPSQFAYYAHTVFPTYRAFSYPCNTWS